MFNENQFFVDCKAVTYSSNHKPNCIFAFVHSIGNNFSCNQTFYNCNFAIRTHESNSLKEKNLNCEFDKYQKTKYYLLITVLKVQCNSPYWSDELKYAEL